MLGSIALFEPEDPSDLLPCFVNHAPPELTVSFEPFENAGCPPDEYGFRPCAAESPLAALGCDAIAKNDLLGGLEPVYPISRCTFYRHRHPEERNFFFALGCAEPVFVQYVIWREDQFHLIETEDELRAVYAPIETAQEALSFTLAVKGQHSADYGLTYKPESYEYLVDAIEDTHVEKVPDGYLVHLFYYTLCGCAFHETFAVDVHVTEQGQLEEVQHEIVYRDLVKCCID